MMTYVDLPLHVIQSYCIEVKLVRAYCQDGILRFKFGYCSSAGTKRFCRQPRLTDKSANTLKYCFLLLDLLA